MQSVAGSIVEVAAEASARYGDLNAFNCLGATLSYHKRDRLSMAFAHWLVLRCELREGADACS